MIVSMGRGLVSHSPIKFYGTLFVLVLWSAIWAVICVLFLTGNSDADDYAPITSHMGISIIMGLICIALAIYTFYQLVDLEGVYYLG